MLFLFLASIQQKFQVELALNCFYVTILYGKYHTCGTQMPNIRDFGNGENIVPLHSEIGVVHRLAADVDYFLCENALRVALKNQRKGKSQR